MDDGAHTEQRILRTEQGASNVVCDCSVLRRAR